MIVLHALLEVNFCIQALALIVVLPTTMPTMLQNSTSAINVARIVANALQHRMILAPLVLQDLNFSKAINVIILVRMDIMITQVIVSYVISHARLVQEEFYRPIVFPAMILENISLQITLA
jgi:hypothetical protein